MFNEEQLKKLKTEAEDLLRSKFSSGNDRESELLATQILKVEPENHRVIQLLGLLRHKQQKYQEARELFDRAITLEPGNYENHNNKALCLSGMGKYHESIECLIMARELRPDLDFIHANLGLQQRSAGMINEAIGSFNAALKIKETCETYSMLGGCYGELRDLAMAEHFFREALRLNPDFAGAHVDLASIHQFRGEWAQSWAHYEKRFDLYEQSKFWNLVLDPSKRLRANEDISGKRVFVHPEQGTGDVIHFYRYISGLRSRGAYVILHCWESLRSLLEGGVDEVYTREPSSMPAFSEISDLPKHDAICSIVSLPYVLGSGRIPAAPYLKSVEAFDSSSYSDSRLKVGIVWAGNPQHPNDKFRSCHLSMFKCIHDIPGVKLFNLQRDMRPRMYRFSNDSVDLTEGAEGMRIVDVSEFQTDYGKTAALVQAMDLVVTVDTSVLHLAGAMGKRTFALLSRNCDWRWRMSGDTTEWYDSVVLFRQDEINEWGPVFEKVKTEVEKLL